MGGKMTDITAQAKGSQLADLDHAEGVIRQAALLDEIKTAAEQRELLAKMELALAIAARDHDTARQALADARREVDEDRFTIQCLTDGDDASLVKQIAQLKAEERANRDTFADLYVEYEQLREQIATLTAELATAKREAVEAFCKALHSRFTNDAAAMLEGMDVEDWERLFWGAVDAELARIREDR